MRRSAGGGGVTLPRLTGGVSEAVSPPLEEGSLRAVGGAGDGRVVGGPGLPRPAEPAQQVRTGRLEQGIAVRAGAGAVGPRGGPPPPPRRRPPPGAPPPRLGGHRCTRLLPA